MKDKKALYIIDDQYVIQYVNKACQEYYPEVCKGNICYKVFGDMDKPCPNCPINQAENETTFFNSVVKEWVNTSSVEMEWQGNPNCNAISFQIQYLNDGIKGCSCEIDNPHTTHCETVCVNKNCPLYIKRLVESQKQQMIKDEQEMKQRQQNLEQLELIRTLSYEYLSVYKVDLESGEVDVVFEKESPFYAQFSKERNGTRDYTAYATIYAKNIHEDDKPNYLESLKLENLRKTLEKQKTFLINYRSDKGDGMKYYQMKFVRIGESTSKAIMGFYCVDEEVRQEIEQKRILSEALVQAQNANKAKTMFLSNMSHDIRTPMNAIIGYAALAATRIDQKERVADYLKKITQSSSHLLSLINNVLDMSRIESGKMSISEMPENIAEIMHDLRSIIQADIRAKHLEFYIDTLDVVDEDIYCDKLRLKQVLLNLLSNAIKFTETGGMVSVRISQKKAKEKGHALYEFRVKDTGIGMEQKYIEHVFEPFSRERNTTVSGIQGTGLGMSIAKSIVDMQGGTIEVHSEYGKGTEFIVTLCFRLQDEPKEMGAIKQLEGIRSLVVDDDMNTCQSVSKMLRQIGMRAEWTMRGKEAVARAEEAISMGDDYQVYIIDWLIPDMNGVEIARQIRKIAKDVPIIILTAYDWTDIEDEAKEAGVTEFMCKPLFPSELRRVLIRSYDKSWHEEKKYISENKNFKGKRILLAEDNEINQEISVEILSEMGFEVEVAENGKIAMEMLQKQKANYYDLILMDIQMPIMNGYEATTRIRALEDEKLANIPIIAMTANAYEEDRRTALEAGMNGHIAKPIEVSVLNENLEKLFLQNNKGVMILKKE